MQWRLSVCVQRFLELVVQRSAVSLPCVRFMEDTHVGLHYFTICLYWVLTLLEKVSMTGVFLEFCEILKITYFSENSCFWNLKPVRNFAKFIGKQLWESMLLNKVVGCKPPSLLTRYSNTVVFLSKFLKNLKKKNTFFAKHL